MSFEQAAELLENRLRELYEIVNDGYSDHQITRRKIQEVQQAGCLCLINFPTNSTEQQIESTIWRQCFYLPISYHRKGLKDRHGGASVYELYSYIEQGFSYFSNIIIMLVARYFDELQRKAVLPILEAMKLPIPHSENHQTSSEGAASHHLVHRLTIYCGDLLRYRSMYGGKSAQKDRFKTAWEIYYASTLFNPVDGHGYNQLAVICNLLNDPLGTTFYHLKAKYSERPFVEANTNLMEYINRFVNHCPDHQFCSFLKSVKITLTQPSSENLINMFHDIASIPPSADQSYVLKGLMIFIWCHRTVTVTPSDYSLLTESMENIKRSVEGDAVLAQSVDSILQAISDVTLLGTYSSLLDHPYIRELTLTTPNSNEDVDEEVLVFKGFSNT